MWFLVTYRRPELARRFVDAAIATEVSTSGVMFVQGDKAGYDFALPKGWLRAIASRNVGLVAGLNMCQRQYPEEPWYGLVADDLIPETPHWDRRLLERLQPMGIVSCNDGNRPYAGGRMCGSTILDGALVRAAGFLSPPVCWHSYTDDWWETVGTTFSCWQRLADVVVRHETPVFGDRPADSTHNEAYGSKYERLQQDKTAYEKWMADDGMKALGRIAIERARRKS